MVTRMPNYTQHPRRILRISYGWWRKNLIERGEWRSWKHTLRYILVVRVSWKLLSMEVSNHCMFQTFQPFTNLNFQNPNRDLRVCLQVTKLMGYEHLTKYVVLLVVTIQISVAIALRHTSTLSPIFILCAYVVGGTANHNLFLAIHEITHNLAFRSIAPNKLLAIFANLPIGIPYSVAFKVSLILRYMGNP